MLSCLEILGVTLGFHGILLFPINYYIILLFKHLHYQTGVILYNRIVPFPIISVLRFNIVVLSSGMSCFSLIFV